MVRDWCHTRRLYGEGGRPATTGHRTDCRGRKGPVSEPAARSAGTRRGPHPTEVDVVAGDQGLLGAHRPIEQHTLRPRQLVPNGEHTRPLYEHAGEGVFPKGASAAHTL